MKTLLLKDNREGILKAAEILKKGGLVAFPTETVYGLGANALDEEAVSKVYKAKGRPSDNPMIVHISEEDDIYCLAEEVTEDMKILMKCFWPGPMTMIVKRKSCIPDTTTGGLETAGIRMPENFVARQLIKEAGCPVAAPSANLSGKPSPTTAEHVIEDLDGRIDGIIVSGNSDVGIESTVIDMTGETPMILRPGKLTKEDFEKALSKKIKLDPTLNLKPDGNSAGLKPKAPGMKYKHYAPKARMIIFAGKEENIRKEIESEKQKAEKAGEKVFVIIFDREKQEDAAREFFGKLRDADRNGADLILAGALPEEGLGFSIMNRMLKSAGYNIKTV